jgi:flagellar protein FliO/FliZ
VRVPFVLGALFAAMPAGAAGQAALPGERLVGTTASLLVVVGVIFFVAWLLKRLRLTPRASAGPIRLLATLPVGPRERLLLVEVGDRQLLIGSGPNGLVHLSPVEGAVAAAPPRAADQGFADRLREVWHGEGGR